MSLDKFKFVTVGATDYRIGRLTPAAGSFILGQIMSANLKRMETIRSLGQRQDSEPAPEPATPPDPEGIVRAASMGAFLGGMDLATHTQIQHLCLSVCAEMQGQNGQPAMPIPISTADGTLLPQIANDVVLVMRLEMEVLVFNLADFFAQGGLTAFTPSA